jgi:hypothetical protein
VTDQNSPKSKEELRPKKRRRLRAEEWVVVAAISSFLVFGWIILFLLFPLLTNRPLPISLPSAIVQMAATRGFVLPPTWTPGPTEELIPTPAATGVYDGAVPTRIYTPRATSLPGLILPEPPHIPPKTAVLELARILQGESPGDREAAYYVGWVAKNRLLHPAYGDDYKTVSNGFFGYRADLQPSEEFLEIARRIIRAREDPTGGCLYALSRTDITKLRVPAQRADVTKGEWFFFRTWPVTSRYTRQ